MESTSSHRYSRQTLLPAIGKAGQEKLRQARVLLVGVGGLGCPAALYLAGAGVGKLGLLDPDEVAVHNLHRQPLYRTADAGRKKTECAAASLAQLNDDSVVEARADRLTVANAREWVSRYDIILDGTDRFDSRYALHDACYALGKPYVYGAVSQFEGHLSLFENGRGPCYRCLYPTPPAWVPNCAEAGVLGVLPGTIGLLQATEALKWILGIGESLAGRLLIYDALGPSFSEFRIERNPDCPLCGDSPREMSRSDQTQSLSRHELGDFLRAHPTCQIVDVRDADEIASGSLAGFVHIPLRELKDAAEKRLSRARSVLVYCQRGQRSLAAAAILSGAGFESVAHLEGGIEALATEGTR